MTLDPRKSSENRVRIFFEFIWIFLKLSLYKISREILGSFLVSEAEISDHRGISGGSVETFDRKKSTKIFLLPKTMSNILGVLQIVMEIGGACKNTVHIQHSLILVFL